MRYCPECGAPMRDDAKFCMNCGKKVEVPEKTKFCDQCAKFGTYGYTFVGIISYFLNAS